jgi:hypothetical protein
MIGPVLCFIVTALIWFYMGIIMPMEERIVKLEAKVEKLEGK